MSFFKKTVTFILVFALCFASGSSALAVNIASECDISDIDEAIDTSATVSVVGEQLEINAHSAVLIEQKSGTVLYEMNADEALPLASITKIMSLLLIMETIDKGNLSLDESITVSEHAASMGGSQIWLEENEVMTVDDLLKAAVIASANDATVALAEKVSGSEEGFVAAMNKKASELGMNSTHFMNATGLDADGHISTAHDVAVMSAELISHELIKKYSTVWMDSLRSGETELVNTNKLVRFYEGTTGLKTGTTDAAGYCLSATAERDGLSLVAVIMAGNTSNDRFNGAKKLLDYGFANYTVKKVKPELSKTAAPVKDGYSSSVSLAATEEYEVLMLKSDTGDIVQKTVLNKDIKAPVKKGDKLGVIEIYCGNELSGTVNITAADTVERKTFFGIFLKTFRGLFIL